MVLCVWIRDFDCFQKISSGEKTIEGRLCRGIFRKVKSGDWIIVANNGRRVVARISRVAKYPTFHQLLENEGIEKVLPGVDSIGHGVKKYRKLYSGTLEEEFQVIGIQLEIWIRYTKLENER